MSLALSRNELLGPIGSAYCTLTSPQMEGQGALYLFVLDPQMLGLVVGFDHLVRYLGRDLYLVLDRVLD